MTDLERVARELSLWRAQILSPGSRIGQRKITYRTMVNNVLDSISGPSPAEREAVIARYFPFGEFRGDNED